MNNNTLNKLDTYYYEYNNKIYYTYASLSKKLDVSGKNPFSFVKAVTRCYSNTLIFLRLEVT